jgi:uncharacterized protein YndB with AHSA1/START domain
MPVTVTVHLTKQFSVPQERVFAALDDHASWHTWLGPRVSVLKRAEDGGVGTIRRVHTPLLAIDEVVLEHEAPKRVVYQIKSYLPGLRYHRGEVRVDAEGDGKSVVNWRVELDSSVPGYSRVLLGVVRRVLGFGLNRLARQLAD